MDFYDFENDISAMARTTAFPCSIVAKMIAMDEIPMKGVIHPAKIGYNQGVSDKFFGELASRNIKIIESNKIPFN